VRKTVKETETTENEHDEPDMMGNQSVSVMFVMHRLAAAKTTINASSATATAVVTARAGHFADNGR